MDAGRVVLSAVIAGVMAAVCTWAGVFGAILSVATGTLALAFLPRRPDIDVPAMVAKPDMQGFRPWLVCTGLFAAFAIFLAPTAEIPAISLALVFLSPLFGTMVLLIESALAEVIWDHPAGKGPGYRILGK
jgi:hypothetical protein